MKYIKMPSSIFLIIFVCVSPYFLSAQSGTEEIFNYPLEAADHVQFLETCNVLSSHPVIQGSFSQKKTISRLNRSLVSGGEFIIDNVLGILWDTKTPFPSTMAVGRDFMIQSIPGGSKTKLNAQGNETFLRLSDTISAVFRGDSQKLLDNFDNFYVSAEKTWTLGLIPRNTAVQAFVSRIIMYGDTVVRRIILFEPNGDTIQYDLSNHTFPGELSADEKALFSL